MALTPRSFLINPRLIGMVAAAVFGAAVFYTSILRLVNDPCPSRMGETEAAWGERVACLVEAEQWPKAHSEATEALATHPTSEMLHNYRGIASLEMGAYAVATVEFKQAISATGSPSGVLENNLAWTTLFTVDHMPPDRAHRTLMRARSQYVHSLRVAEQCERIHTGMFVEYAIANLHRRGDLRPDSGRIVADSIRRYTALYDAYRACPQRMLYSNDMLTSQEVIGAAYVDEQMGLIAGVKHPTRHLHWARAAEASFESASVPAGRWCEEIPSYSARKVCLADLH